MSSNSKKEIKDKARDSKESLLHSEITVKVEKLIAGGAGLARHEGQVVFIADSVPGDLLKVRISKAQKNFLQAEIVSILEPSNDRVSPPCPIADRCGGCSWQHVSTRSQLEQKQLILKETLNKFLPDHNFELLELIPSPKSFRYRNRIQPHYANGEIGFYARKSHKIVAMNDCLICEDDLAAAIPRIAAELSKMANPPERIELKLSTQNLVSWSESTNQDVDGFAQVNRFQNETLKATVLHWIGNHEYTQVYDLYAGSGNFTFAIQTLLPKAKIKAVELGKTLVQLAKTQIENRKLSNVTIERSDVEAFLQKATLVKDSLIVLDPPRAGTSEAIMTALRNSGASKIIYISCHPVSLARDLKYFFNTSSATLPFKYKLGRVQGFEMFPQTDHMETIVELLIDRA